MAVTIVIHGDIKKAKVQIVSVFFLKKKPFAGLLKVRLKPNNCIMIIAATEHAYGCAKD